MKMLRRCLTISRQLKWSPLSVCIRNYLEQKNEKCQTDSPIYHYWEKPEGFDTGITIYNSVCGEKVPLIIRNKNFLKWYSCGPTVYDEAHIGHAFCYVKFDIIRRILQDLYNINVTYQMGITDIDDKIIRRSNEENVNFQVIAKKYEAEFMKNLDQLNVLPPVIITRVTDYIPQIISFIEKLIQQNSAYVTNSGDVCFDTLSYGRYGRFRPFLPYENGYFNTEREIMDQSERKNPADFVLWKSAKPKEPWWRSPWGNGRPGWHIECSAMASAIFDNKLDIHSGGVDLIYPHHEDEIAQSEAYHNCNQWTNYWLHSGHIHWKDEKMSKSLRNVISIRNLLKEYIADDFRIFCLRCPLRKDVNYTKESMDDAKNIREKLSTFQSSLISYVQGNYSDGIINETEILASLKETDDSVDAALRDDFNTTAALNSILNFVTIVNRAFTTVKGSKQQIRNPAVIATVAIYFDKITRKFGLDFLSPLTKSSFRSPEVSVSAIIDNALSFRQEVREVALHYNKVSTDPSPFRTLLKACDNTRENMNVLGIKIKDHANHTSWLFERKHEEKDL